MALESASYPSQLNPSFPASSDPMKQGDDHIRLIKAVLNTTFPNLTAPVTTDASDLNKLDGLTATTAELNILDGATVTTAEVNKLDGLTPTTAQLNNVAGTTSPIQAQLDGKVPDTRRVNAGAGLVGGGDLTSNVTVTHANTSNLANTNNTGDTVIQNVEVDGYGHLTGVTTTTLSQLGTSDILNAIAGASLGAVGTYAYLGRGNANTTALRNAVNAGDTVQGSTLEYASIHNEIEGTLEGGYTDNTVVALSGNSPPGTWRAMGFLPPTAPNAPAEQIRATLFLRIS